MLQHGPHWAYGSTVEERGMSNEFNNHLVEAYNRMLERVKGAFIDAEQNAIPTLANNIEKAREKAVELGEITREEAQRIGDYLQRDLEDAGEFLNQSGSELGDWLRFDLQLIEERLLEMFRLAADRTSVELNNLVQRADAIGEWHTGEITGIGTLECKACGELIHFHKSGHIPPCPKCRESRYRRVAHTGD